MGAGDAGRRHRHIPNWPERTVTEQATGPNNLSEKANANYAHGGLQAPPARMADSAPMKPILRLAGWALLLLVLAVVVALMAALQSEPAVLLHRQLAPDDVARAVELARAHDPRRAMPGRVSAANLDERDVDVLLNHAAQRLLDAATRVSFERGAATVRASVHLPANPFGRWLNLHVRVVQTNGLPAVAQVQAGRLPLPIWLGEWLALQTAARAGFGQELKLAAAVVQRVAFAPQQVLVVYAWQGDSAQRMLSALLPPDEQERLRAYSQRLAEVAQRQGPEWTASLAPFIGPMFELASQRSQAGADAVAENRAAILVLALYANGRSAQSVLPLARGWPRARSLRLTLAGRDDFPRHLLVSAALAVESTGPLSKAVGLYKEIADSRTGSGFSFNDIAANRAGTRLGELAVAQPLKLQAALARGVREEDILPRWADLPEFMPEPEFKRRFGGVGEPAYVAMMDEIERRVDALPVLR